MKKLSLLFCLALVLSCANNLEETTQARINLELIEADYYEDDIPYEKAHYAKTPNHDAEAALGRLLFYDTRLSYNNAISCASCHKQSKAFCDSKKLSDGLYNKQTKRNAMALANTTYHISSFWEGFSGRLDTHILNPVSNHIEMGMRSEEDLKEKLKNTEGYEDLFDAVYYDGLTVGNISRSLASFVGSMISYNSKFDKGESIEFSNFNVSELRGKELFFGKAKCSRCHTGDHFAGRWRRSTNIGLDMEYTDQGAGQGRFKIPGLRNIELTGPYMHDGRFETLEEVIEHYSSGIQPHPELDWELRHDLNLTQEDQDHLLAFLKTLTDYQLISDPKFSNPF